MTLRIITCVYLQYLLHPARGFENEQSLWALNMVGSLGLSRMAQGSETLVRTLRSDRVAKLSPRARISNYLELDYRRGTTLTLDPFATPSSIDLTAVYIISY